jgi:iron complex outermembrane recepter protein
LTRPPSLAIEQRLKNRTIENILSDYILTEAGTPFIQAGDRDGKIKNFVGDREMNRAFNRAILLTTVAFASVMPGQASAQESQPDVKSEVRSEGEASADIVVTGIRGSLRSAQELKRNASSVIEAISAADLGKFEDQSISDSLLRVPGVQLQRNLNGRSGDNISIRGFGPDYVSTTVNGRLIASAGSLVGSDSPTGTERGFNFDQIPTELLNGVTIYKSSTSDLIEPGVAGQVDLKTIRPLDTKTSNGRNFFIALSARGDYDDQAKRFGPGGNAIVGGKFFDNTLGIYGSVTAARTPRNNQQISVQVGQRDLRVRNAAGVDSTLQGVIVPNFWRLIDLDANVERLAYNGGLQWRPNDQLELNVDYGHNKLKQEGDYFSVNILPANGNLRSFYDGTFLPGSFTLNNSGQLIGFDSTRVIAPGATTVGSGVEIGLVRESRDNEQTLEYGGANLKWTSDRLTLIGDISRSTSTWTETFYNAGFNGGFSGSVLPTLAVDGSNPSRPQFTVGQSAQNTANLGCPDFFLNSPGGQPAGCFFTQDFQIKSARTAYRLDASYEVSDALTLSAGIRLENSSLDRRYVTGCCGTEPLTSFGIGRNDAVFSSAAYRAALFPGGTRETFPGIGIAAIPNVDNAGACALLGNACSTTQYGVGSLGGAFPTNTAGNSADILSPNFSQFIRIEERNIGIYGKADFKGTIGDVPFTGNVGLRAVQLRDVGQAFRGSNVLTSTGILTPVSSQLLYVRETNQQWELLPNLNITFQPSSDINVRFGIARVISPAAYTQLAPSGVLNTFQVNPTNEPGFGSSGNIALKPTSSTNIDLTVEKYTPNGGSFIASVFYKGLQDFVTTTAVNGVVIDGQTYNLTTPANFSDGRVIGFEVGLNQPFTFLPSPWDGFGVQANYTFVDSKFERDDPIIAAGIPGAARDNLTVIGYYEKSGLGVRLAYTYRGKYFNQIGQNNAGIALPRFTNPTSSLDGSISYVFGYGIEAIASIQNILGTGRQDYVIDPSFPVDTYIRSRSISFALRFKY